jgi:16S rRNA (uracil1498-N3)-methyltransferase
MRQVPRLFVAGPLAVGAAVSLEGGQVHYLGGVLRLREGAPVWLCDDMTGEWDARVAAVGRKRIELVVEALRRPREAVADLWLCAAPIKGARWEWVAEKACELGVARLVPVLTERTVVRQVNAARLRAHMIEAAEQCGRTALPELADAVTLPELLAGFGGRRLVFADEDGREAVREMAAAAAPAAVLIGPEGGFSDGERAAIRRVAGAVPVSLGPRILRADTAAVAAVALWQAFAGDGAIGD